MASLQVLLSYNFQPTLTSSSSSSSSSSFCSKHGYPGICSACETTVARVDSHGCFTSTTQRELARTEYRKKTIYLVCIIS